MLKKHRKLKITLISISAAIVVLCGGFYIYTLDYYRASEGVADSDAVVNAQKIGRLTVFYPGSDKEQAGDTGIIFYPGGKVEAIAYAPLLTQLAERGYTCVLAEMPMNLAVFDINAVEKVYEELPEIENWYLMGHSLGGAMASSYCGKNGDKLAGLILLGAYPVNDADLPTLVIYGSEDHGLDMEKVKLADEVVRLEGGNHAYFGNYGEQAGDGEATISRDMQQVLTVDSILSFLNGG